MHKRDINGTVRAVSLRESLLTKTAQLFICVRFTSIILFCSLYNDLGKTYCGRVTMEKIFTERAHLMCPGMNFGIAMSVNSVFDKERITAAFDMAAANHPFLNAVLGYEKADNSYFYDVTGSSKIGLKISDESLNGIDDPKLLDEYKRLTGYDWDIRTEGMLKASVWKAEDNAVFLLVFHHLLADGRGALGLAEEIAQIYVGNAVFHAVPEKLISSEDDLPVDSKMPFISKTLVENANRNWKKEGHEPLSYEKYHQYADSFVKSDKVKISLTSTSQDELAEIVNGCRNHFVTVNDYLMAKMFIEDKTEKIIIARDIRDSLPFYQKGALGNYSTAFSVVIKKPGNDVWKLAGEVHKKVQKTISEPKDLWLVLQCYANLTPEVLDGAFMAAKGAFESKSASFIGKMFFGFEEPKGYSITNLGKIENTSINSAFFIPPASPAIRKTVGILTVNGEMRSCVSERN